MWDNIIAISSDHEITPVDEVEGLTFMDRRKNYQRFGEVFAKIAQLKDQIKKDQTDKNAKTDPQDEKTKLNKIILNADVELDQIEDSQLEDNHYTFFIHKNIKEKNYFKAA